VMSFVVHTSIRAVKSSLIHPLAEISSFYLCKYFCSVRELLVGHFTSNEINSYAL